MFIVTEYAALILLHFCFMKIIMSIIRKILVKFYEIFRTIVSLHFSCPAFLCLPVLKMGGHFVFGHVCMHATNFNIGHNSCAM